MNVLYYICNICFVFTQKRTRYEYTKQEPRIYSYFLSLSLVGCGGGGDSSSDNLETPTAQDSLDDGTRYYSVNYELDDGSDNLTMQYYEIFNKQFKSSDANKFLGEYINSQQIVCLPA